MKISSEISVAFTGNRDITPHRGLKCVDLDGFIRLRLAGRIEELYRGGYRYFLSGGAVGFDILASEVVLALRDCCPDICLVVVVPFEGQDAKYSEEDRSRYEYILSQAADIVVVSDNGYDIAAYHQRNDYLVRHSSHIIAYSNGRGSGTKSTIKLAKKLGIKVENLYNMLSGEVEDEQLSFDFLKA